ncbi:MAG: hypothetical protein CM15mP3_03550 [Candidatus Poseidoniales archaeon]|nr:MAG: hypothetical protein CM15mP3_03550 [Candidatus Poseidoniales archaeon]
MPISAIKAYQTNMAIEAGTLFIELSLASINEDAKRMQTQVDNAKPRKVDEPEPELSVHPKDIDGVFDWCYQNLPESNSGEHRPDLRAMVSIAKNMINLITSLNYSLSQTASKTQPSRQ